MRARLFIGFKEKQLVFGISGLDNYNLHVELVDNDCERIFTYILKYNYIDGLNKLNDKDDNFSF